jgi:hypothetical protein
MLSNPLETLTISVSLGPAAVFAVPPLLAALQVTKS